MSAPWLPGHSSQSFLQRHSHWHNVLDPSTLLASHAEIQKSKSLLESVGPRNTESEQHDKVTEAQYLCQASVHPDSGNVLPLIFRPPVYVLLGAPLVAAALIPHASITSAFLFQLPFQTYNSAFTAVNGNRSMQVGKSHNLLYLSATALTLSSMGVAPLLAMKRLGIHAPSVHGFFGRILPPPLFALFGGLSVVLMRLPEVESGVQVVDGKGNVVGASHRAAEKALKETALSRTVLLGSTALVPSLMKRSPHMMRNPRMFNLLRLLAALFTFGVMVPMTFSFFPQKGSIRRDDLEEELKEKTEEKELFYNRGL